MKPTFPASGWWFRLVGFTLSFWNQFHGERDESGQIITTSAEVTLNGGLIRELPQNPLNSGLGIILICPDEYFGSGYIPRIGSTTTWMSRWKWTDQWWSDQWVFSPQYTPFISKLTFRFGPCLSSTLVALDRLFLLFVSRRHVSFRFLQCAPQNAGGTPVHMGGAAVHRRLTTTSEKSLGTFCQWNTGAKGDCRRFNSCGSRNHPLRHETDHDRPACLKGREILARSKGHHGMVQGHPEEALCFSEWAYPQFSGCSLARIISGGCSSHGRAKACASASPTGAEGFSSQRTWDHGGQTNQPRWSIDSCWWDGRTPSEGKSDDDVAHEPEQGGHRTHGEHSNYFGVQCGEGVLGLWHQADGVRSGISFRSGDCGPFVLSFIASQSRSGRQGSTVGHVCFSGCCSKCSSICFFPDSCRNAKTRAWEAEVWEAH